MASKTVNEDLMIVTMGSKHIADTKTPTDKCFLKDKKTIVPYRNYIPTADCDNAQATQKTLIRNYRIIHNETKIGNDFGGKPSKDDPAFAGFGGGVANGQVYFKHANDYPGQHSKNVKVEGKWIVRTNDETQQNKRNTTGKFYEGDGGITEDELEQLLNKGCTVESVTMKCKHRDTTVDRISVLEGDTITLTMVHVNDAEVEPGARAKPQCQVPRRKAQGKLPASATVHPYWRVTRSAYPATEWRKAAFPLLTKDMPGLTITIGEDWIGPEPPKSNWSAANDPKAKAGQSAKEKAEAEAFAGRHGLVTDSDKKPGSELGTASGNPNVEGARMRRDQAANPTSNPAAQARGEAEAAAAQKRDEENRAFRESMQNQSKDALAATRARQAAASKEKDERVERAQTLKKLGEIGLTTYQGVMAIFLAKPVEVKVEAMACAGAKVVTVAAYPPKSYSADLLDLKEVKNVFKTLKDAINRIKAFLGRIGGAKEKEEGKAAEIAIESGRYTIKVWILADAAAELGMQYRELTRDALADEALGRKKHEVFRAYTLELKLERLIGIEFKYSVPVALCAGAIGAFAVKLLDKCGVDLSFNFGIELSLGVSGSFEFNEYGKFIWLQTTKVYLTSKFTIALNAEVPGLKVTISVTAIWQPSLAIERSNDKPLVIKRPESAVTVKWAVTGSVNIFGWLEVDVKYGDDIWVGKIPEAAYSV